MADRTGIQETDKLLSIGELAKRTGIAVDTIRVWERRYGKPTPIRLPSGHRRYTVRQVRWLRRVKEALTLGHRPSKVIHRSERQLTEILREARAAAGREDDFESFIDDIRRFRAESITRRLKRQADKLDRDEVLARRIAPVVRAVGRAWADGNLEVRHEHFFSEALEDFLRGRRQRIRFEEGAPKIVLTTLSGEEHDLGLQMAALVCAESGVETQYLGTNTPVDEIVEAAVESGAQAVGISVSLAGGGVTTDRMLFELRRRLPPGIELMIGGAGARGVRRGIRQAHYVDDLDRLPALIRRLFPNTGDGPG